MPDSSTPRLDALTTRLTLFVKTGLSADLPNPKHAVIGGNGLTSVGFHSIDELTRWAAHFELTVEGPRPLSYSLGRKVEYVADGVIFGGRFHLDCEAPVAVCSCGQACDHSAVA